jgi:exopolysaccharide production protein ExoZ
VIRPIQYLRAIAALMVACLHCFGELNGAKQLLYFPILGLGVDIFFVISGFIMLVTTWEKPITPRQFMTLRIVRIVPLYWLMTLSMLGAAVVAPGLFKTLKFDSAAVIKSLLFIPYDSLSDPGHPYPVLDPGWTLNYEMFFYALFALSLFLSKRFRLWVLLTVLAALVVAGRFIAVKSMPLEVYTDPKLLEFATGIVLGLGWLKLARPAPSGKGNALFLALGNASYSIYLSHLFTLGALRTVWVHIVPSVTLSTVIAFVAVGVIASAIGGWLCYTYVEVPMTAWFRTRLLPRRQPIPKG